MCMLGGWGETEGSQRDWSKSPRALCGSHNRRSDHNAPPRASPVCAVPLSSLGTSLGRNTIRSRKVEPRRRARAGGSTEIAVEKHQQQQRRTHARTHADKIGLQRRWFYSQLHAGEVLKPRISFIFFLSFFGARWELFIARDYTCHPPHHHHHHLLVFVSLTIRGCMFYPRRKWTVAMPSRATVLELCKREML